VIALHQAGYENVVSPMGTALTDDQLRLLKRFTRKIVLALDPDTAGQKAVLRGLEAARQAMDREGELGFDARGLALTFQQASDMERMVQMGSGSMDSASPLSTNRRNETASGMSMLNAGFLKRSKRTMKNLERQFLDPLVRRCLWRYMQFDPERYPTDMVFRIRTAMGLMAKEVEQGQLAQMLGYLPPESPAHKIVVKAIFDNTASAEKDELKKAMDAMLQPPDPQQQQMQQMIQQIQLATAQAELAKTQAEAALAKAKAEREKVLASLEDDKVQIEAANAAVAAEQVRVSQRKVEVDRTRQASKPKSN